MRTGRILGIIAIVVLSVAAGTFLGILLDRSVLRKRDVQSVASPARTIAITAAEVPEHFVRLSKLGHTSEGARQAEDFAQNLAPAAFPTAVEQIGNLDAFLRQSVLLRIFERWGREDPAAALDATARVPVVLQSSSQNAVYDGWAKRDANALIAWAERNTNTNIRRDALLYGARELASHNPKAALDAVRKLPPQHRKSAWAAVFSSWTWKSPEAALKELARLLPDPDLQAYYHSALMQWMQKDPQAAIAWLKQQPDDSLRRASIQGVAHVLGTADPVTGYALIQSLPGGNDRQIAVGAFAGAWTRQNSSAAVEWARALPDGADKDVALTRIIEQLGETDPRAGANLIAQDPLTRAARDSARSFSARYAKAAPEAAFEWAQKLPQGETREEVLVSVLKITGDQSPAKAAAACTNLLTGVKRDQALRDILRDWVAADPAAAAAFAINLPSGRERNETLSTVVRSWTEQNVQAAMQWVLTLESGAARREGDKLVVDALARTDPAAAAGFIDKLPAGEQNLALLSTALDFWMPKSFDAASAWVEGLNDEKLKHRGYERLANHLLFSNPARAASYAENTGGGERSSIRSIVAGRWAETDPQAAAAWAMRLGTNRNDSPLPTVISAWSRKAPAEAAAFIEKLPVDRRRNVSYGLISAWTERDPRAAAQWVAERSPEEMRESAARGLVDGWARRDARAAIAWVRELPAGNVRDAAASALASSLADDSGKLAGEVVELIGDPGKRNNAIENVARQWLRNAPEEARVWLATNSLPAARKERLLKSP